MDRVRVNQVGFLGHFQGSRNFIVYQKRLQRFLTETNFEMKYKKFPIGYSHSTQKFQDGMKIT